MFGLFEKVGVALAAGGLGLLAASAGPLNDDFADAEVIAGPLPSSLTGSNVDATAEADEPDHAGFETGKSVWWSFTPDTNASVEISTEGSSFDTVLGVYTGASLDALVEVASNDNSGLGVSWSRVSFDMSLGVTYWIAVDGTSFFGEHESGGVALTINNASVAEVDYYSWIAETPLFGPESDPLANPDNDAVSNLLEYAFNLNPNSHDAQPITVDGSFGLPRVGLVEQAGAPRPQIVFLRRRNASDLTYTVEFSSNPSEGWSISSNPNVSVEIIDEIWERVSLVDLGTGSTDQARFARLRLNLSPGGPGGGGPGGF